LPLLTYLHSSVIHSFIDLNKHVSSLSRNFYTRALRHIRPALTESMAATLSASLVQSRLDYSNSIMYGMSAYNMLKLQSAQNCFCRDSFHNSKQLMFALK